MNKFETHVNKITEYIDKDEPRMAFDEYKKLVDKNITSESGDSIIFHGKKGQYLLENAYLVEQLMAKTKKTIKLYVDDIDVSSYGHVVVRNMLHNWLKKDEQRDVKILVRKGFGFLKSNFYYTNLEFIENGQIEAKTLKDGEESLSYAGIFDSKAIKIKKKEGEDGGEVMVGNFSDQTQAQRMEDLFDDVYDVAIPVKSTVALIFNKYVKNSTKASSQTELVSAFVQAISNRVNESSSASSSIHFNRYIPL